MSSQKCAEWTLTYSAWRALSAGEPACAKWSVPDAKVPGTMVDVSMPKRFSYEG